MKQHCTVKKAIAAALGTCLVTAFCTTMATGVAFASTKSGYIGDNCHYTFKDGQLTIEPKNQKKEAVLDMDELTPNAPDGEDVESIKVENGVKVNEASAITKVFSRWDWTETADLSGLDVSSLTDMSNMFYSKKKDESLLSSMESLDLSGWNTSNVTNTSNMFKGAGFEQLDVSGWNTSSLQNASCMFSECMSLKQLDLSSWNTSSLQNASCMFNNCEKLSQLDVSGWNTSAVTNMSYMFSGTALTSLDLSAWDMPNIENLKGMFSECEKLKELDISGWGITTEEAKGLTTKGMFAYCGKLKTLNTDNKVFKALLVEGKDSSYLRSLNFKRIAFKAGKRNNLKLPIKSITGHKVTYKLIDKKGSYKRLPKSKIKLNKKGTRLIVKNLKKGTDILLTAKCGKQSATVEFVLKRK